MQFADFGQPPTSPLVAASARWVSCSGKLLAYSEQPVFCHFVGSGARLRTDAPTRNSPLRSGLRPDRATALPDAVALLPSAVLALRAVSKRALSRAAREAVGVVGARAAVPAAVPVAVPAVVAGAKPTPAQAAPTSTVPPANAAMPLRVR